MAWPSGAQAIGGMAISQDGALYVESTGGSGQTFNNPTITGTVTASQVTGIPVVLAQWGAPVGLASSGTMGNNGAVSGMTAHSTIYSGGIWLYYPAGAVAVGVPAAPAFLWTVMSSTTAGTVYNSTWDGSGIPPLGTATAYATTGPGAFTGVSAGEITAATITIPAGAMGPNGEIFVRAIADNNTAVGNKILRVKLGAVTYMTFTQTTNQSGGLWLSIRNAGLAALQKSAWHMNSAAALVGAAPTFGAVDTASATTLTFTLEKATATNHLIWGGGTVQLVYGA
jgi:hypothetical protein